MSSPSVRVMRGMPFASVPCDRRGVPTSTLGSCLIGLASADPDIGTVSTPAVDKTRCRSYDDDRSLTIKEFTGAIALRCTISAGCRLAQGLRTACLGPASRGLSSMLGCRLAQGLRTACLGPASYKAKPALTSPQNHRFREFGKVA